jgi:hypothetical protein
MLVNVGSSCSPCSAGADTFKAYHNSLSYLATWAGISAGGEGISSDLSQRPLPIGMLYVSPPSYIDFVSIRGKRMTFPATAPRRLRSVTLFLSFAGSSPQTPVLAALEVE